MMDRIDLVMWIKDPDLDIWHAVLEGIAQAVPRENVCHRILIDASRDRHPMSQAAWIATGYGWETREAEKIGIPQQANQALKMVDTEFYASFEQDVILHPDWFTRTFPKIIASPDMAVIQGIRVNRGSKLLEALDARYAIEKHTPVWYYSLDNNLNRTSLIRKAGGYPYDDPFSADGFLRKKLIDMGYQWKIEPVVSWHVKDSFWQQMRNQTKAYATSKILYESYSVKEDKKRLLGFIALPMIAGKIAAYTHTPSVLPGYLLLKYGKVICKGLYLVVHGKHRMIIGRPGRNG